MPRTVQPSVTARIPRRPAPVIHTRPLDPDPQLHDDLKRRLSELELRLDEGVPMVFELGAPVAPGRVHRAHAVYLPAALGTILNAVEQARRECLGKEGALPTSMLRLLLETQVPDVLRTEVKLYKLTRATPPHPMVITTAAPDEAQRETRKALASWMLNHLDLDDTLRSTVTDKLRTTALEVRSVQFDPSEWRGGLWAHRDLADLAARALEGTELFPGRGGLRRVYSRDMTSGTAELLTDPYRASTGHGELPTSYVVKLKTKTFPGRPQPLLVMELSRRQWTANANTFLGKVTLYAFPARSSEAPQPSVAMLRINYKQHLTGAVGLDYKALRQKYPSLPEQVLVEGRLNPELLTHPVCQVMAVARQGRGARGGATGALDWTAWWRSQERACT